jgi:hypothetical protein
MVAEKLPAGAEALLSVKVATGAVKDPPVVWGVMVAGLAVMESAAGVKDTSSSAGPWFASLGMEVSSNSIRVVDPVATMLAVCNTQSSGSPTPTAVTFTGLWPVTLTVSVWLVPGLSSPFTAV